MDALASVYKVDYFERAITHEGHDLHCLAGWNVVRDLSQHRPGRHELR